MNTEVKEVLKDNADFEKSLSDRYKFGLIWGDEITCLYHSLMRLTTDFVTGINIVEVGCREMKTGKAMVEICRDLHTPCSYYGIDVHKDYPETVEKYSNMMQIIGDANDKEILSQLPRKLHFILIDSCHCYQCVTIQGKMFSEDLTRGGIIAFHDYGTEYQGVCGINHSEDHDRNGSTPIEVAKAVKDLDLTEHGFSRICEVEKGHGIIMYRKR